ncbi:MAG: amidohydrolase family protein, partial [Nitrospinota bacterium]
IPVGMVFKLRQPDLFLVDDYWHAAAEANKQMETPYDLVNVRDHLTPPAYEGLMKAARENGRYVGGHLPDRVDLNKALSSGLNEVATLGEYLSYFQKDYDPLEESSGPVAYEIDFSGIQTAVKLTAENGVAVGTGLVADERAQKILEDAPKLFSSAEYGLVRPEIFESWRGRGLALEDLDDKGKYLREEIRPFAMELAKSLHDAGVTLVAGTSVLDVGVVPGVHMHRELELLVEAGLSPFDALSTATRNAAKVAQKMNGDAKWGTVAEGMRADLLLLSANPLEDIKNIRTIKGVMVRGRWYGLTELEKRLDDYKKSFSKIN